MPRYDDEYGDYGPPFPGKVKAAGVIWIAFGAVGLAVYVLSFLVTAALTDGNQQRPSGSCGPVCGMLFCGAFIYVGAQTVRGTAKDTLGNAIGSLVFGLLYAFGCAIMVVTAFGVGPLQPPGQRPQNADTLVVIAAVSAAVCALFSGALIAAGALALSGRRAYREWREENGFSDRRRRRRCEYDDDAEAYDERLRGRREDRDD